MRSCFRSRGLRPTLGASGFSRAVPGRYSVLYFLQKTVKKRVLIGLIVRNLWEISTRSMKPDSTIASMPPVRSSRAGLYFWVARQLKLEKSKKGKYDFEATPT